MRRIVLCLALSFVAPAMAQSTKTRLEGLEQRLGQLEEVMKGQALVEMSQRVDQLERELRELRGEADALAQANAALKKQQLDIAADLEQRLAAIEARERAAAEAAAKVAAPSSGESPATPAEGTPGEPASVVAESDGKSPELRYGEAFDALKAGKYPEAIAGMQEFLAKHPNHPLADNAQYWLGQTFYVTRDYERAIAAFAAVGVRPTDPSKTPDALLKKGLSEIELKRPDAARATLADLVNRFPNSEAARTARERLQSLR
ncbi:MAG: tol-pal system protein YbgF [Steroidobacteraceae bacterium]|jgi:tol-pal system protein YbgF